MNDIGLNCENTLDVDFFQLTTVQFTLAVQINVVHWFVPRSTPMLGIHVYKEMTAVIPGLSTAQEVGTPA